MNAALPPLPARLDEIRGRIEGAERRSGRSAGQVTLVAAIKTISAPVVVEAVRLGLTDLGESRVQETEQHREALAGSPVRWHMIGHLQRNKAGRAAEWFDRVHSVDDAALAETLARRARACGRTIAVLVQVNVSGEASKFGVSPAELERLLESVAELDGLALDGLMTIGPEVATAEAARPGFARLRELRDRAARALGLDLPQLSMGMSGDYEVAVEEGATLVRIGSALFGPRG